MFLLMIIKMVLLSKLKYSSRKKSILTGLKSTDYREAMRSRQIAERLGVEEAHMLEFQQFNICWDKKMQEYEEHAQSLSQAMKERHVSI